MASTDSQGVKKGSKSDYNGYENRVSTNLNLSVCNITVNGEPHQTVSGQTLSGLLAELSLDPARVAIELNRQIVKAAHWDETRVPHGAEVEIVQFVGGG